MNIPNLIPKYQYLTKHQYFIKYYCYFSCKNDISNIIYNSSICVGSGDKLKILVMKKYILGDIAHYNWTLNNFDILKELIKQIFYALYLSYINFGFIHNDVHFANFLIKEHNNKYYVVILDFENSLFDISKKDNILFLYKSYLQILNNIFFELNIKSNNIIDILEYIDKLTENIDKLTENINIILELIDNISFNQKINKMFC